MIVVKTKLNDRLKEIKKKAKTASFKNLFQAGAFIRTTARRSLRTRKKTSAPGQPPHSPTRQLKNSVAFKVNNDKDSVVIGPQKKVIATIGAVHEFGLRYKGFKFKKRPFMGPALRKALPRIPKRWANSIK